MPIARAVNGGAHAMRHCLSAAQRPMRPWSQRQQVYFTAMRIELREATMCGIPRRTWLTVLLTLSAAFAAADEPAGDKTVKLTIDYGDGVQKVFPALPWQEKMTVLAALDAAQKHPRGIKLAYQGSGERVLVTAIDGLKNEGRGKNWLYEVNGKLADKSCGVHELSAGDAVLWRFAAHR
jgi:hypothetical protein